MSRQTHEELSVLTLGGGEAIKQVDYELQRVIENCLDVNKDAKAKRSVTLKIAITPNADRSAAVIEYQADAKLAPDDKGSDHLTFYNGKGYVFKGQQMSFDDIGTTEDGEKYDKKSGEILEMNGGK